MEKWTICNKIGDFNHIEQLFGVTGVTSRLLINRGINTDEAVKEFLYPQLSDLNPPSLLLHMDEAANFIAERIRTDKKLRVVGDYDVDGIMATYILNDALKRCGADADYYIPHRIRDGYGLNEDIIAAAVAEGVDTVITCDNGISAVAAAEKAEQLGISLVITDHHEVPELLPPAVCIVDPKQEEDSYPCREICGAVVAAKLAESLFKRFGMEGGECDYLEFMAMATICDVVELKGENRVIAKLGMQRLKNTPNYGLAALIKETGIDPESLSEYHIGFVLGPCFNATGRIDDAGLAMDLLTAKDAQAAEGFAQECKKLNDERKAMTAFQEQIAFERIDAGSGDDKVIVLELEDCHESLLGIIAGRVKERYNKPAIIITKSGENYKGSARSVPGYNMYRELCGCSQMLVKFGGHPMAAGLTLKAEYRDDFPKMLNELCSMTENDMARKIQIDAEADFRIFDEKTVGEISLLAPFGQGNPSPLFAERNLKIKSLRYMGKDSAFLRFRLENSHGGEFTAVCFGNAHDIVEEMTQQFGSAAVDAAFAEKPNPIRMTVSYLPRINEYRDTKEIQMLIKNIKMK